MGLDMYLTGEKFYMPDIKNLNENPTEDGFRLKSKRLELGYWRKHPNLHGYIVDTFADGEDCCQEIELDSRDLQKIIDAIQHSKLPRTEGFFFGASANDKDEKDRARNILTRAIRWLQAEETGVFKVAVYRASW